MTYLRCRDREQLAALLRRDPALHAYELGDLDDFFWPDTTWYLAPPDALTLLYTGGSLPTLLALCETGQLGATERLLAEVLPLMPATLYAHLTPGLERVLTHAFDLEPHGEHLKLRLPRERALALPAELGRAAERLDAGQRDELAAFYAEQYPGNWFVPRMLETGWYFGLRQQGRLVAVAGVHVVSARYGVAALGNIATARELRGQGLARAVTGRLCRELSAEVATITLNVKADNRAALACYHGLGFTRVAPYREYRCLRPA